MRHTFTELVIGGVLVSPFLTYAVMALVIFLLLRPTQRLARFGKIFSHPSVAQLSLYVVILGLLTVVL
jgi:Protein of unknown function (DUF1656)